VTALPRWPAELPVLTDGEIVLRYANATDADDIVAACVDRDVAHWTVVPQPYRLEHALGFINEAQPSYHAQSKIPYVIADARTDQLIGSAGIHDIDLLAGSGEMGYWVAPAARGRGVAARAVTLQLGAARLFGLHRFWLLIEAANLASIAVARRAGFTFEGEVRATTIRDEPREHQVWVRSLRP